MEDGGTGEWRREGHMNGGGRDRWMEEGGTCEWRREAHVNRGGRYM